MGITKSSVRLLLDQSRKKNFQGSVLQLGRQSVYLSWKELQEYASLHEVELQKVEKVNLSNFTNLADRNYIDDITLFQALGFQDVYSCDASKFEGATYVFDLNYLVPESMCSQFDLIINGGTIEHIFHLPNALLNIHNMLKISGQIIHFAPTSNHVDHGFYCFSPTLFYDYYHANQYTIDSAYLFEQPFSDTTLGSWKIYHYQPGCLDQFSVGGLPGTFGTYFVATKTTSSTGDVIPQQNFYQKAYGSAPNQ
jgi:hypothetical protein